jgi:dTDP-4-amino-4,6-dideoxygalactose transaminase
MIPFLDLKAQYKSIQAPLELAVLESLRNCDYVLGEAVNRFESAFAEYCGTREAISLNSGTSALHLALLAAGVGPGDEVVTVSATFVATVASILYTGATPVLVDIDSKTLTMDPAAFERAITSKTKAVIPVHLHGRLADMGALLSIATRHGITVIEDAAQAHGAQRNSRRAGSFGAMGCFSFYPGKNLGACGEGGAVTTDDSDLAAKLRCLRDWGQQGKYNHILPGYNYRMDTLQAAALGVKVQYLPEWTAARRRIAALYNALLAETDVRRPSPAEDDHVYHVYAVQIPHRDIIQAQLMAAGVATGIHYPTPVHQQPAYANLVRTCGELSVSEWLAEHCLSLPIYPELATEQVHATVDALLRSMQRPESDVA